MFGFSVRKILGTSRPYEATDLAALEIGLDSIDAESKRIQRAIVDSDFNDLPKRAKKTIAVYDALCKYTEALVEATLKISLICHNLRREREGEVALAHYSTHQLRQDKAAYDASVRELRRWGARLMKLFDRFRPGFYILVSWVHSSR